MVKQKEQPSAEALRFDYLQEASWYWYIAVGDDENLVSTLHRVRAEQLKRELETFRLPVPEPEEILAHAKGRWPEHRLHKESQS